jgi:hypothetical protein
LPPARVRAIAGFVDALERLLGWRIPDDTPLDTIDETAARMSELLERWPSGNSGNP